MASQDVVVERSLDASLPLVWQAITDIELLKKWSPFFPDFKPEVGFVVRFKLGPDKDHQYEHICEVMEVVPKEKISYTWHYAGYPGNSLVTYELWPEDNDLTGVKLTNHVTEAYPNEADFSDANRLKGWTWTMEALDKFIKEDGRN